MNPTGNWPVIWNPPRLIGWWDVEITSEAAAVPVRSFELTVPVPACAGPYTGTIPNRQGED